MANWHPIHAAYHLARVNHEPDQDLRSATSSDVLDPVALERLNYVALRGDPQLVARLVELFLADTPTRLDGLREALADQDEARLRVIAHGLRGSSETFGAHVMVDHCRFLEEMPPNVNRAEALMHIDALVDAYARTRAALERLVS